MAGGQSEREDRVSLELTEEILQSMENGRISSMDFHRTSSFLVTASDDESIRLYDVTNATYTSSFCCFILFKVKCLFRRVRSVSDIVLY
ncbi:unnamed protein product [Ilex paraguariensis]|uniref:Uncharacterized protein n=1 Tax=Ilex paraguariensis TaxID=185542 RepID=A0ABC8UHW0_9AQUA